MIKILIVEDEQNARESLKRILGLVSSDYKIIGETSGIDETLNFLEKNNVDLVLLDVELKDGNSFDLLKFLNKIDFQVIFTTAYNEFAIKAFKFNAIDYLLKPIDPYELKIAVRKARERIEKKLKFDELLELTSQIKDQKIRIKTSSSVHIFKVSEIIRLEANGAYTHFITSNQNVLVSKNLRYYESLLSEYSFIRVHRSHLINFSHIKQIQSGMIKLTNNDLINVSSRKRKDLAAKLDELN